jgi:hypothetical protein
VVEAVIATESVTVMEATTVTETVTAYMPHHHYHAKTSIISSSLLEAVMKNPCLRI